MSIFSFPKEWEVEKNVPKEIVYKVSSADGKLKKIFVENVKRIRVIYALSTNNTNIEKFITDEERYDEINVLKVELRDKGKENIILKTMHQLIPKGTVIILVFKDEILISLAKKKIKVSSVKIEEVYNSEWIQNKDEYLQEFNYKKFNSGNLKFFYESIIEKIKIYKLSKSLKISKNIEDYNLDKLEVLNGEIEELKALRKKETQINRIAEIQSKLAFKIKEKESYLKGE